MTAEFLSGQALSNKIKYVCEGTNGKFAVAFWGGGAAEGLFGGKAPADAKIICDISMGGTNPDELGKLGAPKNENLHYINGLHAKVYLSDNGAVIGSANASDNGVGFSGDANLVEAGIALNHGSDAWKAAKEWFDKEFESAHPINEEAIEYARLKWNSRSKGAGPNGQGDGAFSSDSLLKHVVNNPDKFLRCCFIFGGLELEPEEEEVEENRAQITPGVLHDGANALQQFCYNISKNQEEILNNSDFSIWFWYHDSELCLNRSFIKLVEAENDNKIAYRSDEIDDWSGWLKIMKINGVGTKESAYTRDLEISKKISEKYGDKKAAGFLFCNVDSLLEFIKELAPAMLVT